MALTDRFLIDGHKADWHRDRVARWLAAAQAGDWELAKKVYPIYVEVAPVGGCNHRCTFCAVDYIGYEAKHRLETDLLRRMLGEMAEGGVRSVMWAGEGEPLIHKELGAVIAHAKSVGIDSSITTNGVLMTEAFCRAALPNTTWIKVSVNGGSETSYTRIHKARPQDWEIVWRNIAKAAELRRELGATTAIGVQSLLLPEIWNEFPDLARRARDAGADYIVVKPYSQHNYSVTRTYSLMRYGETERLAKLETALTKLNTETFQVVFRSRAMADYAFDGHRYDTCLATPSFWAYVMADGEVYGCSAYLKEPLKGGVPDPAKEDRFMYGNVRTASFRDVWEGEKRRRNWEFVRNGLDISECRKNCRMNQVNKYLTQVLADGDLGPEPAGPPPEHINFI